MTDEPDAFRPYGDDLSHAFAAILLRGDREGVYQRIHQLLNNWGVQNGLVETLVCDLVSQYATALLTIFNNDEVQAAEYAEQTALDKEVEENATINQIEDLELPPELIQRFREAGLWEEASDDDQNES